MKSYETPTFEKNTLALTDIIQTSDPFLPEPDDWVNDEVPRLKITQ